MNVHDISLEWLLWSSWLDRFFIPGVALIASEKMSGLQNSSASSWMMFDDDDDDDENDDDDDDDDEDEEEEE